MTVTVSDTRTLEDDASGRALAEELAAFTLVRHVLVQDEPAQIQGIVHEARSEADAILFCGGTGIAPRDRTWEALVPLFDKTLDGFGEAFRRLSWEQIGARAMLSRAVAGTIGTCLIVALPGSEKAARLGATLVAEVLDHAVDLLNGRTHHGKHGHGTREGHAR